MPFETFFNLPHDKQYRITQSAVMEFSQNGYQGASIDSIACSAMVSKGSMYQYFNNKKELFLYIFDYIVETKIKNVAQFIKDNKALSYFETLESLILTGIENAQKYPESYQLYQKAINSAPSDIRQELNDKIASISHIYYRDSIREAMKKGIIRKDISIELAAFVVYTLLKEFSQYILNMKQPLSDEDRIEIVKQFINVLKNGIE